MKAMNRNALLSVGGLCLAVSVVLGQQTDQSSIYTSAQAVAGHVAYDKTCGRCHTLTLMGRHGNPDEQPAISSLSEADRKFLVPFKNRVPPLAGKEFLQRWGPKTAAQLVKRFQEAGFSFKEAGLTDEDDILLITAYVLQVNGAKAGSQALTRQTSSPINSVVE
jgi:hypothetical protein